MQWKNYEIQYGKQKYIVLNEYSIDRMNIDEFRDRLQISSSIKKSANNTWSDLMS